MSIQPQNSPRDNENDVFKKAMETLEKEVPPAKPTSTKAHKSTPKKRKPVAPSSADPANLALPGDIEPDSDENSADDGIDDSTEGTVSTDSGAPEDAETASDPETGNASSQIDISTAPAGGKKSSATSLLSQAVKSVPATTRKKLQKPALGHSPRATVDNAMIDRHLKIIDDIYEAYDGEDLDGLAQQLTKAGLHVHIDKDTKDRTTPIARTFYHDPVIARVDGEQMMLDGFFVDLKFPKPEKVEEEETEEPKKRKWKLFSKKKS